MAKIKFGFLDNILTNREKEIISSYPFILDFVYRRASGNEFLKNLALFENQVINEGINISILNFLRFFAVPEMRLISPHNWKLYWKAQGYTFGSTIPWHGEREIRVFKMPDVSDRVTEAVISGYTELLNDLNLNFKITYFDSHNSTTELVNNVMRQDGKIDSMELHISLFKEPWRNANHGGKQHGDITIVNNFLIGYEGWWGGTHFDFGSCIISVPGVRQQNLHFIKNVAKHEATHMFGYGPHHDDAEANVKGYFIAVKDCLAFHRCTSLNICLKCKDAIVSFWQGVGERTRKEYIK